MQAVANRRDQPTHNHFVDKNNRKISFSNSAAAFIQLNVQAIEWPRVRVWHVTPTIRATAAACARHSEARIYLPAKD